MTTTCSQSVSPASLVALVRDALRAALPASVSVQSDPPFEEGGLHLLDVIDDGWSATLTVDAQGRLGLAAGLSEEAVFGELADEGWGDWRALVGRVVALHAVRGSTAPSLAGFLSILRTSGGVSQRDLAQRLGVSQPAVSALESRTNVGVDTLVRAARRLRGVLSISVDSPEGRLLMRDGEGPYRLHRARAAVVRSFESGDVFRPPRPLPLEGCGEVQSLRILTITDAASDAPESVLHVATDCERNDEAPLDAGPQPPRPMCQPPMELGAA